MRFTFQFKSLWQIIFLIFFFVSHSCVYYNTFYNAQKYFKNAEKIRLENENRSLPVNAQTAYTNVIEKCDLVLEKYPDSDYVNSALLLSGQAHYHKEEYNSAESKMKQLQKSGDSDFIQQGKFWATCRTGSTRTKKPLAWWSSSMSATAKWRTSSHQSWGI